MPSYLPLGLTALAFGMVATGCSLLDVQTISGSGVMTTEQHDLADFDRIDVSRRFEVTILPGDGFAVSVSADDNVARYLEIEQTGATLRLDIDDSVNLEDATVTASVTMPTVEQVTLRSGATAMLTDLPVLDALALRLSGGSELSCRGLDASSLVIDLSGSSDVDCQDVTLDQFTASLDGGSDVRLTGEAATATIEGSGSSELELGGFRLAGADVTLSGGSEARLTVSGVLEAELRDGSEVRYTGDPVIGRIELHGGSTLEPH